MSYLPLDIQENIYKRLDPKDRVKFRLAFPKSSNKIWNPKFERKLAVVNNFIKKNKKNIRSKEKILPYAIMHFLYNNQDDYYIKHKSKKIGINIEYAEKKDDINKLFEDIRNNKIKNLLDYNFQTYITNFEDVLISNICAYANVETFNMLYEIIQEIFKNDNSVKTFIFGLINYRNKTLFEYIMNSRNNYEWINIGISYIQRPEICSIFTNNSYQIHDILKYFDLSLDVKKAILQKAEENLYEDTALLMYKYLPAE